VKKFQSENRINAFYRMKIFGFKDGTLLKNSDDYYLVSDGKLRKFKDGHMLSVLGFSSDSFQEITTNELDYNEQGDNISDIANYPNDS